MKTKLVRVGNSSGVRIPKPFLESVGLTDAIEMTIEDSAIVLRPGKRRLREGWEEAFAEMHDAGDDQLLDEPTATEFDESEWEWPK